MVVLYGPCCRPSHPSARQRGLDAKRWLCFKFITKFHNQFLQRIAESWVTESTWTRHCAAVTRNTLRFFSRINRKPPSSHWTRTTTFNSSLQVRSCSKITTIIIMNKRKQRKSNQKKTYPTPPPPKMKQKTVKLSSDTRFTRQNERPHFCLKHIQANMFQEGIL